MVLVSVRGHMCWLIYILCCSSCNAVNDFFFSTDSGNFQFEGKKNSVSQWDFGTHALSTVVQRVCRDKGDPFVG